MKIQSRHLTICISLVLLLVSCVTTQVAQKNLPQKIVDEQGPSIVTITTYDKDGKYNTYGTGFFVSSDGIIATNNHVLKNAYSGSVKTFNGTEHDIATILDYDEEKDVALIKIDKRYTPSVTIGNPIEAKQGDSIVTIGNPSGFENTVSDGIISAIRDLDYIRIFQITCPISPGSSGGPLFNNKGEVIGITTLMSEIGQNLNFAVSIDALKALLKNNESLTLSEKQVRDKNYDIDGYLKEQKLSTEFDPKDCLIEEACELYEKAKALTPFFFDLWGTYNEKSIELLENAVEINPNYHAAILTLARSYSLKKSFKKSEYSFKKTIEIKPLFQEGYIELGTLYLENYYFNESINYFQKALEMGPGNGQIYNGLGEANYDLMNFKKSEEWFKKTLELKKEYSPNLALLGLSMLSLEQNNIKSAWKYMLDVDSLHSDRFEERIRFLCKPYLENNNFYAFAIDGHLDYYKEKYKDAIKQLAQAKYLNPTEFVQYYELGLAYLFEQYHKNAVETLLVGESIPRLNENILLSIGYIYSRSKQSLTLDGQKVPRDYEKAKIYFLKVKNNDPENYYACYSIAYCLYCESQYYHALNEVKIAIKINKKAEAYQLEGDIYYELKDYKSAIESYTSAIEKEDSVYLRVMIANAINNMVNLDKAISYLEKILNDDIFIDDEFDEFSIKKKLADFYFENDDYEKAIEMYLEYLKKYPNSETVKFNIGLSFLRNKEYNEAIKWFNPIVENDKDNFAALHNIGYSYYFMDNYKVALTYFNKAYEIQKDNDTKNYIDQCTYQIDLSYYPDRLTKASNKNDDIGIIAKLLLIVEKYGEANNLWIQGTKETKYVDGENIVSSKLYEAKAIFEITLKDLKSISTKNTDFDNINNKIEIALNERITGSELSSSGYYKKRKDYQGEFEKGNAKIKIANRYFTEALKELGRLLPKYNTNFTKVALSSIEYDIKYYDKQ